MVTVGGSGVGADLLRRAVAAYPAARAQVPGLRMVVVAGPRIDPASLTSLRRPTASRCAATCTTCTGTWPRATWPWCRAG